MEFTILLATGDTGLTVEDVIADLNVAINDYGLLAGNYLVSKTGDSGTDDEFWRLWTERHHSVQAG